MRYVVLATFVGLLALACQRAPASGPSGISDDKLVAYVRWRREYAELVGQQMARINAIATYDHSKPFDEFVKESVRQGTEVTDHFGPLITAHWARLPLQDEMMFTLAEEATGGLFHYTQGPTGALLIVARDEERIRAARRRFGAEKVDDILARESLILAEVDAASASAAGATTPEGMPSADELNAFFAGAGDVHLGMSEKEVSKALGSKPTRRKYAPFKDFPVDIIWDSVGGGAHPGSAIGHFEDDRLIGIEFVGTNLVLPRIDRAMARTVLTGAYVQRSYARTLRIADIEAAVGSPGVRVSWIIASSEGNPTAVVIAAGLGPTTVASRWMWEVVPGDNDVLYVQEDGGTAGQPYIRKRR